MLYFCLFRDCDAACLETSHRLPPHLLQAHATTLCGNCSAFGPEHRDSTVSCQHTAAIELLPRPLPVFPKRCVSSKLTAFLLSSKRARSRTRSHARHKPSCDRFRAVPAHFGGDTLWFSQMCHARVAQRATLPPTRAARCRTRQGQGKLPTGILTVGPKDAACVPVWRQLIRHSLPPAVKPWTHNKRERAPAVGRMLASSVALEA